jgi:hypothetical protein
MSAPAWSVRRLHALDDAAVDGLADVLIDCVEGGASVSFMHPLHRDRAIGFWRRVAQAVAHGERAVLVAEDADGLCGTVQLVLDIAARDVRASARRSCVRLKPPRANAARRSSSSTPSPTATRHASTNASDGNASV